ncbi:glycosyltransferase family 2 protein [Enterococcus cecorum]|uniref:Glycosyl transferase n=1 Tax=Enterococcus cecorum DSM 20682 = ATCC 43198 TaxID=1121864 RepID=S1RPE8_9ENTE|nr:glycosyltransferase [Enterococcus cecorum]EOX18372.1 glycosyl transferase [Enterococcus cecorum DSM 20682 = ATCC 43198]ESK61784.1 glycosyl transferase [Enterococcus cecorum DSM 20682 = ATCC 43198]MDZ5561167.1 glycosyltransferase family 2 protein [Enterococcus cecorum]OJG30511.1 glycosyl transferase [Enterococcus cecorum DSM 20682 = ATCC 43198]CAI3343985.1 glycosyltransferase family 2 protein [Enterococcus cecorum]
MLKKISIVIPCYNEEETIAIIYKELVQVDRKLQDFYFEYIFINDGSTDDTLLKLRQLSKKQNVHYLSFSRNFGKEAALYAGLKETNGDYVTVMDADLQDPPELLIEMVRILERGEYDCVGTRRINRRGEPSIRSWFARKFYQLINHIGEVEMVDGARDFRLMTRQMVDSVLELSEYNRFSKGLFAWVGYNTKYLEYENRERVAGQTSWSFWSLFKYSIDGIVNFSEAPLNLASFVGAFSCFASIIAMIFIVVKTLIFKDPTSGWPSLVCIILFIGGIQLLCLGIVGKYISKIFLETKKRPIYIVKERDKK